MASHATRLQRIEDRCAAGVIRRSDRDRWAQQRALERLKDTDLDAMAVLAEAMDAGAVLTAGQQALLARWEQLVAEVANG